MSRLAAHSLKDRNATVRRQRNRTAFDIARPAVHRSIDIPFIQRKSSCACGGGCPTCQEKSSEFRVSRPNDPAELEADQIAERVMRMPADVPIIVKNHSHESDKLQAKCSAGEEEEETAIQRKEGSIADNPSPPGDGAPPDDGTTSVKNVIGAGGYPLDHETRTFFEPRFGYDFSRVRVHSDDPATQTARATNAQAFTIGHDIVFNSGQYRPNRLDGRRLLAHELTHVVQQERGGAAPKIQRREDPGAPVAPAGAIPRPAGAPVPAVGRPSPDERTRHSMTVVDFGQNTNVYNWREAITHIGDIEAESVDQMVADVIAEVGDPATDCISRLTLIGHGSPGNVSVGDGTGWMAEGNISTGNFRPSIARLTPFFCNNATVVLYACNVGRGPRGARFIQTLADFWQVNVVAPTGYVDGFGIMGVWVWGLPGQVLPSDTGLIVDQITRILDETTYGDDEEMIFELLEAGKSRGLLAAIEAELMRQGRWAGLGEDLRDEDEDRYNRLFP